MNPVVTRLYAVLVALTLVGLAVWAGADWYQLQQRAETSAQASLRQAAGQIAENSIKHGEPILGTVFTALQTADPRWKTVVLWSEHGTEYYRGPRTAVPVDKAVPRWESRALTEIKLDLPVFRAGESPLALEAIYEFYGAGEFLSLLKGCGVTLVILLVLTSVIVVLSRPATEAARTAPAPRPQAQPQHAPSAPTSSTYHQTFDDLPHLEEPAPGDPDGPSLFAPSGLGWESFLAPRLDRELDRTAGQNQDLTLLLFGFKGDAADSRAWAQSVRDAFPSVDLDFEYGTGAAVVLPGQTLEQALKTARAFVEALDKKGTGTVHAGAASRSGRLIAGDTLLTEAGSALRRSLAGTVRVLGLKADPDRYREHLASVSA